MNLRRDLVAYGQYSDAKDPVNANTITLNNYALADAYVAWTLDPVRITFNVDNLTDTAYASWSDIFYLGQTDPSVIYANQVMLGAPRTYSVMLHLRF